MARIQSTGYDPAFVRRNAVSRREESAPVPAQEKFGAVPDAGSMMSEAEHTFFSELFPQAASEIRSLPTYHREGLVPAPRLGSIIDKKG